MDNLTVEIPLTLDQAELLDKLLYSYLKGFPLALKYTEVVNKARDAIDKAAKETLEANSAQEHMEKLKQEEIDVWNERRDKDCGGQFKC